MDYKKMIAEILVDFDANVLLNITEPSDRTNGDYSLPCFKYSKELKQSPAAIAQSLLPRFKGIDFIDQAFVAGGYLNFRLNRKIMVKDILTEALLQKEHRNNGKTICIDYSSINIAKPFHIGHLLTTAIGGSLYRIFKYLGFNVVGINHLGDWGTQFGKLIVAYKKWGSDEDIEKRNINALLDLYVKFHAEAEMDESLNEESRKWFKKIEDGDSEALSIFNKFKTVTLKEVQKVYDLLGVQFDSYNGESFYNDKLEGVIQELNDKKLLSQSEGAKVVNLDEFNMPPCLVQKSDGASLYATRDLAAAKYRKETYNFDKCLYVVAYQQNLHFQQVFKTLELMGYEWAKDCVHIPFGMVSLENSGALSTRKGNVVFLVDVLNTAINKTKEIIESKNSQLENKEQVALDVGVGAVIFGALNSSRIKDTVFSYESALNFDGETSPYIQYTHARCCSILAKSEIDFNNIDFNEYLTDEAFYLVKLLGLFEKTIEDAASAYEPSLIARYLVDLAQSLNKYYIKNRIAENNSRLVLTAIVEKTIKSGLNLILINAPNKM